MARNAKGRKYYGKSASKGDAKNGDRDYRGNNGKRYYDKNSRGNSDRAGEVETIADKSKVKFNDPAWYAANEQIAKDAASFSFNTPTGTKITLTDASLGMNLINTTVPGTYSIYTAPAFGYSFDETSSLNIAMRAFFRDVRKGNSGSTNYSAPDMAMYIFAMDSVYAWIATLTRLYGLIRTYSVYNRYYADAVTWAQGFDPSVGDDPAWLRGFINKLVLKANQFAVPSNIPLIKRHYWMFSNVFLDEEDPKAQTYMYVPAYLYRYDELSGAGTLIPTDVCAAMTPGAMGTGKGFLPRTFLTKQDIINITATLLNPIIQSQDFNVMSGDIVKVFGGNTYSCSMVPDDFQIIPAYSKEVMYQIHNTSYIGGGLLSTNVPVTFGYDTGRLIQQTNPAIGDYLVFAPLFAAKNQNVSVDKILDMPAGTPTPGDVLVASRNMIHGSNSYDSTADINIVEPWAFGSDFCLFYTIGQFANNQFNLNLLGNYVLNAQNATILLNELMLNAAFHLHPSVPRYDATAGTTRSQTGYFYELDNWRVMTRNDLTNLHDAAVINLMALPSYAGM